MVEFPTLSACFAKCWAFVLVVNVLAATVNTLTFLLELPASGASTSFD